MKHSTSNYHNNKIDGSIEDMLPEEAAPTFYGYNGSDNNEEEHTDDDSDATFNLDLGATEERDEVKEIQRFSKEERNQVVVSRWVVTFLMLYSAMTILLSTNAFLQDELQGNYETAFRQFAEQLTQAARTRLQNIDEAFDTLVHQVSLTAENDNNNGSRNGTTTAHTYDNFDQLFGRPARYTADSSVALVAPFQMIWDHGGDDDASDALVVPSAKQIALDSALVVSAPIAATSPSTVPEAPRLDLTLVPSLATLLWSPSSIPRNTTVFSALLDDDDVLSEWLASSLVVSVDGNQEGGSGDSLLGPKSWYVRALRENEHEALNTTTDGDVAVALVVGQITWSHLLTGVLPTNVGGIQAVMANTCGEDLFTFSLLEGEMVVTSGDKHNGGYDDQRIHLDLQPEGLTEGCRYSLRFYPTPLLVEAYESHIPTTLALVLLGCFFMIAMVFCMYDASIRFQTNKILANAALSNAIVTQFFPGQFRDQIMGDTNTSQPNAAAKMDASSSMNQSQHSKAEWVVGSKSKMKLFLSGGVAGSVDDKDAKPLADLFLDTTVMFADIVGFTAWSSQREPSQVFTLLETVYGHFDALARRRRIFKVETVGDCYVAVTGLPDPRPNHALAMCKFARDIMSAFRVSTTKLESSLGPDTGDLQLRVGIHSGPVTAGVLRGERSRFQLFGDTVNTTARMESTSLADHIQLSQETADLLIEANKQIWIEPREGGVTAKGKGGLQTYWLTLRSRSKSMDLSMRSNSDTTNHDEMMDDTGLIKPLNERTRRLIAWNTEALYSLLKKIVARREAHKVTLKKSRRNSSFVRLTGTVSGGGNVDGQPGADDFEEKNTFLEEVKEIIHLPAFDREAMQNQRDPRDIELNPNVYQELRDYVTSIAVMYRSNPFHNFEHASHVTMSVTKLLSRIVAPSKIEEQIENALTEDTSGLHKIHASLHDHTYGITSDPLTQFACAFSALVHDVDHTGVPNARLMEENPQLGRLYGNRSIAEQNSLHLAWTLLMDSNFDTLRAELFAAPGDLKRFRELVVNSVMATDIADKDLKVQRNMRWDKAFGEATALMESPRDTVNRKATIVIEHLIQASDVSHTMQHWHVFRKWNERLFSEMYVAYKEGRAAKNPADFWAKGEIGFFDYYIIPLAKKLKDCGVFGVSSDECLNYAESNRREWEIKGEQIVAEMMAKFGDGTLDESVHVGLPL